MSAMNDRPFHSPYTHHFVRTAVAVPRVHVADPVYNTDRLLELARRASDEYATVTLFPELVLTGYSCDDLFHQDTLLVEAEKQLERIVRESRELNTILLVGLPLRRDHKLFNCVAVVYRGQLLGLVPKTYLPNYNEFYEKRQFRSGRELTRQHTHFMDEQVPIGSDLIFRAPNLRGFGLHVEICEDLWPPIPPSTYAAMAGATLIANPSASNVTVGKADYRRDLVSMHSARTLSGYMFAAAGLGESTNDMAWDGHAMICENGQMLCETERFKNEEQFAATDLDMDRLVQDRMQHTSFNDCTREHRERVKQVRTVDFHYQVPDGSLDLKRDIERFPYVPSESTERDQRCYEVYNIQVNGLQKRMEATGIEKLVIGISGGLDSTQALIVAARAMDRMGLPRTNILAYTMPGFATSDRTLNNARRLMDAMGVTSGEIDIRPSSKQMLEDIGHPYMEGEEQYDVTFENVQAGDRASHLFRLANHHGAMVVGTGDLSELALGWTTYGVGDQMSHYAVNVSVPKTLIQYLIGWSIKTGQFEEETHEILQSILDTEISPELVPGANNPRGKNDESPAQSTEEQIGPYELQDFHLYYISRFGYRPSKVAYLAYNAWSDLERGDWPDTMSEEDRNEYDLKTIKKWLEVFLDRFIRFSQFKRSAIPNGPKVGSGGSLSPRGDWRAPSDATAEAWLKELKDHVPDE